MTKRVWAEFWVIKKIICGKLYDYLHVDSFPTNFFVLICPPNSFGQFGEAKLLHPLLFLR
jgi:hypothetical protein